MRILITGGDGFIGRNLRLRLAEAGHDAVDVLGRGATDDDVRAAAERAEFVFHVAGVNRPVDASEFVVGNVDLTRRLCDALRATGRPIPVVFTSSTQAALDNPYGRSKRAAEEIVEAYGAASGAAVRVLRLPNVFGKWSRPNYNSAVATFCHNVARGLPITVHDPVAPLNLVYIDDVVDAMLELLRTGGREPVAVSPVYATSVGEVAGLVQRFAESRRTLDVGPVGAGLERALYATYVSFLPPAEFTYALVRHADARGVFVEMLRTPDAGQFSFFTAGPGITRGGHYHHTKTEKFLVLLGRARFDFRHVVTGERLDVLVDGAESRVVETVPGWAHSVTNVGDTELVVMLWANETFDPQRPDTIYAKVVE